MTNEVVVQINKIKKQMLDTYLNTKAVVNPARTLPKTIGNLHFVKLENLDIVESQNSHEIPQK